METEQKKVIAQMVLKETNWVILSNSTLNILTAPSLVRDSDCYPEEVKSQKW